MPAFVTGGSGFVGGDLVRSLVADGIEVRALARSAPAAERIATAGGGVVSGDVFAGDALAEAMRGCDVVYHVAGINQLCPRDPAALYRVNVDGTYRVVAAAARAGVPRVVVTSSAAAIGEPRGVVATEDTEHSGRFVSHYARSKKLGEDAAFAAGRRFGIDVIAVNPSSVQGPDRTDGSARLLHAAVRTRWPLIVDTTVSLVDISDCTEGHRGAAQRGRPGRRYLLSGGAATLATIVGWFGEVTGRTHRPITIPRWLLSSGTPLLWLGHRVAGGEVCPELVATLLHGHIVDGSRATRELGLDYTPLTATVRRAAGVSAVRARLPKPRTLRSS